MKERQGGEEELQKRLQDFVAELKSMPIAIQTETANEQHYEVPTAYFLLCLGRHLKYSSCLYPGLDPGTPLSSAEEAMLGTTQDALTQQLSLHCKSPARPMPGAAQSTLQELKLVDVLATERQNRDIGLRALHEC